MKALLKIHGGKYYLRGWIISNFPHEYQLLNYAEPCCGGCNVLLEKQRSLAEIINDADVNLINMYRFLITHPEQFATRLAQIEYSEENFNWARNHPRQPDLESAVAELCTRRMSRGGLKKSFSWSERIRGNQPGDVNAFQNFKQHLPSIIERLQGVQVENLDIKEFVQKYNQPEWFLYLDPPYLPSTRRSTQAYGVEMSEDDHADLCDLLKTAQCKVLISGYQSPLYFKALKEWNFVSVPTVNHSGQTKIKEMRVECAWSNY